MRTFFRVATVAVCLGVGAHAQVIGTVVSAQGSWCDKRHQQCGSRNFQDLWRMYLVQRDSKLIRLGNISGHELLVIRSRWGALETFDCTNTRELGCKEPLDLTRLIPTTNEKNVVTAFFDAVLELAADHPKVYDALKEGILRTRGSKRFLSDGVAELRDGGLSLENVFLNSEAGQYLVELCALDDSVEPNCPSKSIPVNYSWNPDQPVLFPVKGVRPGLYRLYLYEVSLGMPLRTANYADLVVAEQPQSEQLTETFHLVLDATQSWDRTDLTAPALRRAYLYTLALR